VSDAALMPNEVLADKTGATLAHIELLRAKQERLRAAQIQAEEQVLHSVGALFAAGEVDEAALVGFYNVFSAVALPGFTKRWNAAISCNAGRVQSLRQRDRWEAYHAPNMPDGTWNHPWPLGDHGTPANGVPVVYVLYDDKNVPCYVGSSEWLRGRLQQHERDGKLFVRWTASQCPSRDAAYELEDRLLSEFKPYLNTRAGR